MEPEPISEQLIELIRSCPSKTLRVTGLGKLRMVHSDKWYKRNLRSSDPKKQRRARLVERHMNWKTAVQWEAKRVRMKLTNTVAAEFHMPIPKSYTKKEKRELPGQPHQKKPDADNMLKGLIDALVDNDSHIWLKIAWKVYTDGPGKIVIYDIS
jgi:Holliday junction resolvase RusA-like endonuclease